MRFVLKKTRYLLLRGKVNNALKSIVHLKTKGYGEENSVRKVHRKFKIIQEMFKKSSVF